MTLNEENARITLLGCILTVYVFFGALIINKLESPFEKQIIRNYLKLYGDFEEKLTNGTAEASDLKTLLYMYGNVTATFGAPGRNERWNFLGSLHFVVTIVTTIGYGSYTPNTDAGKIFVIIYGFLGCAGGILFFNLFLERMITFLAYILREMYVRKMTKNKENNSDENTEQLLAEWKPSIYSVVLYLFLGVVTIGLVAIPTYSKLEGWSYVEAAYFCFVSFSTIGFGDFVAAQHPQHNNIYVFANIVILALGCCFLYSIFNVISIVLKLLLNCIIFRLKGLRITRFLPRRTTKSDRVLRKYSLRTHRDRKTGRGRRSSIQIIRRTFRRTFGRGGWENDAERGNNQDGKMAQEATDRKMSDDGLISMKDFLTSNQVSLALMQKQLQESAQQASVYPMITIHNTPSSRHPISSVSTSSAHPHRSSLPAGRFIPGTIGPLAILCDKLG